MPRPRHRPLFITPLLMFCLSAVSSPTVPPLLAQGIGTQRVEILIQDYAFVLTKPGALRPGLPTALILRNQDIVRHGFTSPAFPNLPLNAEGEGVATYGKGIEGVYVDPGKTIVLYFTPQGGANYTFRCDLHQHMKGELLTLELPAA